jgi:topoisomerase-4 subunit A
MATSIPPHNMGELCAAARRMIAVERLAAAPRPITIAELMEHLPGPDFPTGGVLAEEREAIAAAYRTGRGSLRLRASWAVEETGRGSWVAVVTEIPYGVQKAKLVERIAALLGARKLTLLADVRDESTEDVRLVLEPKSRSVEPALLMAQLFQHTELESRFAFNMNALDATGTPRVMGLDAMLRAWLEHRHEVLVRRSRHRLAAIARRVEILDAYLAVYAHLDEVIRIIREEDEPRPVLMARFGLTDTQAGAILEMRLKALRRLDGTEIRQERARLEAERQGLDALLADARLRWRRLDGEVAALGKRHAADGRRTRIEAAPAPVAIPVEALVEREPVTVILSRQGWIRAVRGHLADTAEIKLKEGDELGLVLHAQTTDRLLLAATNGKLYTLAAEKLPRGRGFGEPVRLSLDLPNDAAVIALTVFREDGRMLLVGSGGKGFVARDADLVAQTRAGKQVMIFAEPGGAVLAALRVEPGLDGVACLAADGKLLAFLLEEVPEMTKGQGVVLQKLDGSMRLAAASLLEASGAKLELPGLLEPIPMPALQRRGGVGKNLAKRA